MYTPQIDDLFFNNNKSDFGKLLFVNMQHLRSAHWRLKKNETPKEKISLFDHRNSSFFVVSFKLFAIFNEFPLLLGVPGFEAPVPGDPVGFPDAT